MINSTLSCLFLTFSAFSLVAQKETNIWYFGHKYGLDFNSGSPVIISDGSLDNLEGNSSISDANGQILFYTDGDTVWNRNHQIMQNGTGLGGNEESSQSSLIVQKPGSATQYYIFTTVNKGGDFAYSQVDMTLDGGLGGVSAKNMQIYTPATEKLAAVRHANGQDVWVITHAWNSDIFYVYLVTSLGISTPFISAVGSVHQNLSGSYMDSKGYLKVSPDGSRIALVTWSLQSFAELFDFDNSTGLISNPISLPVDGFEYGVSFSPDNSKLYVTTFLAGTLYQFDLCSGNAADIIASRTAVGNNPQGALQIGPDGKIYAAQPQTGYIGVVNSPDLPGALCDFQSNAINMNVLKTEIFGFPNFIESYFNSSGSGNNFAGFTFKNACEGDTIQFFDASSAGVVAWTWDFGDTISGANDSSALQNPVHLFSSADTYQVTLTVNFPCGIKKIMKTVIIYERPDAGFTFSPAEILLDKETYFTNTSTGANAYFWDFGDGTFSTDVNPVHIYGSTGEYSVMLVAYNDTFCSDTAWLIIAVIEKENDLFVPTAFTPNSDGTNDLFTVYGKEISEITLRVFNRWGEKLFESSVTDLSAFTGWNGARKGKPQNTGIYVYAVSGKYTNGNIISKQGTFALLK